MSVLLGIPGRFLALLRVGYNYIDFGNVTVAKYQV